MSNADHLASIFGTEKDKVNCSFYLKMGACRHGDRCDRKHIKPTYSQTIVLYRFYENPAAREGCTMSQEELQDHFDDFYKDVFYEMEEKYGEIEEMNVCDNLGEHLLGNVYIMFKFEENAEKAVADLNQRWYEGRPLFSELSPVSDFHEACCRQYDQSKCQRGDFCNFQHIRKVSDNVRRLLYGRNDPYLKRMRMHQQRGNRNGGRRGGYRRYDNDNRGGRHDGGRSRDFDRRDTYVPRGRDGDRESRDRDRRDDRDYNRRDRDYDRRGDDRDYERNRYDD